jgi:hypothetical protein
MRMRAAVVIKWPVIGLKCPSIRWRLINVFQVTPDPQCVPWLLARSRGEVGSCVISGPPWRMTVDRSATEIYIKVCRTLLELVSIATLWSTVSSIGGCTSESELGFWKEYRYDLFDSGSWSMQKAYINYLSTFDHILHVRKWAKTAVLMADDTRDWMIIFPQT